MNQYGIIVAQILFELYNYNQTIYSAYRIIISIPSIVGKIVMEFMMKEDSLMRRISTIKPVTLEQGVTRMQKAWRQKLWIELARDKKQAGLQQSQQENNLEFLEDHDELRLDKHTATVEHMKQLYDHINLNKGKKTLLRLEIQKVLFTGPKAQLLAQTLSHPNCAIKELAFIKCRAKSEKMVLLFGALKQNTSISSLILRSTNIPRDSVVALVDLLDTNKQLQMLTLFNAGLNDNFMNTLAPGLKQSHGLIYLDMRQNTFEDEGFRELAKSLTGHKSLLTLRINGMYFGDEEISVLKQLFGHPACSIQNFECEELEVTDGKSNEVIDAVKLLKRLFTFDYSNNHLSTYMMRNISEMIQKYRELEILCLDHCDMPDALCSQVFGNFQNTNLQFLNISWNLLTGDCINILADVLDKNQDLEKLCMQHNKLGEGDFTQLAKVLRTHKKLKYLDVSANEIDNQGFRDLYQAVQNPSAQIQTFYCRKNIIGGSKILDVLENWSSNTINFIDLSRNKLNEKNSKVLLEYARNNIAIEQIILTDNVLVNAQIIKDIGEECLQNVRIKQKVLTKLQPAKGAIAVTRQQCYRQYDVSELCLKDQRLDYIDFVQKFVRQNMVECHKLLLCNLNLDKSQSQMKRIFSQKGPIMRNIRILHFEDSDLQKKQSKKPMIGAKVMKKLILCLKKMRALEEIHFVNLVELEPQMLNFAKSLEKHKHIKVLDLRQNFFRKRDISALVPLLSSMKGLQMLDISKAIISKRNMQHLWLGLHYNVSVCKLKYSRINFLALDEIGAIEGELYLNELIRDQIRPRVEQQFKDKDGNMREVSLRGFHIEQRTNPAVIKYMRTLESLQSLDISSTGLSQKDIKEFILGIADRSIQLTTLKLSDNQTVDDQVVKNLSLLFTNKSTLKHLYLDQTRISLDGLKLLLDSIKGSLKVRTISTRGCNLNLKGEQGQSIVKLLSQNISLTTLGYDNNEMDVEFWDGVKIELELNKSIVLNIFPKLINQELEARQKDKAQKEQKKRKLEALNAKKLRFKNRKKSLPRGLIQSKGYRNNIVYQKQAIIKQRLNHSIDIIERRKDGSIQNDSVSETTTTEQKLGKETSETTFIDIFQENQGDPSSGLLRSRRNSLDDYIAIEHHSEDSDSDSNTSHASTQSVSAASEAEDFQLTEENIDRGTDIDYLRAHGGFQLQLDSQNLALNGIEFVTKFTRVFRQIDSIDFGDNKLDSDQLEQFSKTLKLNKYIKSVCYKKKGISKNQERLLNIELQKNKAINELSHSLSSNYDTKANKLDLADQKLKKLSFLPKMIQEFSNLESLDLSNSDLRNKDSILQLCQMIDENNTIKILTLRHCSINANALSIIADALTKSMNKNLKQLDIRDNPIQDPQYKVLFGLLQNNQSLLSLDYTLYGEENNEKLRKFKIMQAQGLDDMSITQIFQDDFNDSHHHPIPRWQKICFPIWCWKSLIHDKHEAFRFKYNTEPMKKLEEQVMPSIKRQLYCWSLIYYLIVFVVPYFFIDHECEKTFNNWLFFIFAFYMLASGIWETYVVFKIQKFLNDGRLLQFNKWHFVELIMGSVARTDTFLDICFVHIIANCWSTYLPWVIPALSFAVLNLLFPTFMLLRLLKSNFGNALSQPNIESTCFAAFIRETMLLATVLDSFCINNSFYFMEYPLVFGKLMGFISFFTQDFPQLTIHVMFKLLILSEAQKKLKTQKLLLVGMCVSTCAVLISIFNMVMCAQNEFDPLVLEQELSNRRRTEARMIQIFKGQKILQVQEKTKKHIQDYKKETQKSLKKLKLKKSKSIIQENQDVELRLPSLQRRAKSQMTVNNSQSSFLTKVKNEYQVQNNIIRQQTNSKLQNYVEYLNQSEQPFEVSPQTGKAAVYQSSIPPEKRTKSGSVIEPVITEELEEDYLDSERQLLSHEDTFSKIMINPVARESGQKMKNNYFDGDIPNEESKSNHLLLKQEIDKGAQVIQSRNVAADKDVQEILSQQADDRVASARSKTQQQHQLYKLLNTNSNDNNNADQVIQFKKISNDRVNVPTTLPYIATNDASRVLETQEGFQEFNDQDFEENLRVQKSQHASSIEQDIKMSDIDSSIDAELKDGDKTDDVSP